MTANLDFDRQVTAWLDAAWPSDVAPEVVDAARHEARSMRRPGRVVRLVTGPGPWPPTREVIVLGRRRSPMRVLIAVALIAALVGTSLVVGSRLLPAPTPPLRGILTLVGRLPDRWFPSGTDAIRLRDGRVLVQADDGTLHTWDADSRRFADLSSTSDVLRAQSSLFELADGRVAIVGGDIRRIDERSGEATTTTVELFDAVSLVATSPVPVNLERWADASILLRDGRILSVGGVTLGEQGQPVDVIEAFDPARSAWSHAGSLVVPRVDPELVELADGRVLIVGGADEASARVAEVFDPSGCR